MNAIHPTAVITGDVVLGTANVIGPFVVITGPVRIGDGNWFGAGTVIGALPEVRSVLHDTVGAALGHETVPTADQPGLPRGVVIGNRNVVREYAQVHQGWQEPTVIGDDAFIMNQAYIAHDAHIGSTVTIAGGARLAGHVHVGEGANIGLGALIHQRRRIGVGCMVGMGAVVTRDVPDFAKVYGNPARVHGINQRGAESAGLSSDEMAQLTVDLSGRSST